MRNGRRKKTGLPWFVDSVMNSYLHRRHRPELANWSLALMSVCLLFADDIALVIFSPVFTSKPLADAIVRVYQPGEIIQGTAVRFIRLPMRRVLPTPISFHMLSI